MKVQTLLTRFEGVMGNALQGFTPLEVLQAVIDDLWADEVPERLVRPAYITTIAGTLVYHFDADNDQSLNPIIPGLSTIRRVRGIFKPSLTNTNISDYNYKALLPFDQNVLTTRLYDGAIDIDNELRKVTFRNDPQPTLETGVTEAATWQIDYYPQAPKLDNSDDLPVLPGEEMTLLFPGMRAFAEEWKTGNSEYWRPMYNMQKTEYRYKIRIDKDVPRLDDKLYYFGDKTVQSQ